MPMLIDIAGKCVWLNRTRLKQWHGLCDAVWHHIDSQRGKKLKQVKNAKNVCKLPRFIRSFANYKSCFKMSVKWHLGLYFIEVLTQEQLSSVIVSDLRKRALSAAYKGGGAFSGIKFSFWYTQNKFQWFKTVKSTKSSLACLLCFC